MQAAVLHSRPLAVPMFTFRPIPRLVAAGALGVAALTVGAATAQDPAAPIARLLAETTGLQSGPDAVRIDILAWSTDEDRGHFVDAWNLAVPPGGRAGTAGARGGSGRGARGGAASAAPESGAAPAGGRGARGGRGGPPAGGPIATAAPVTPAGSLAAALQAADGVGYLWSSESVGYSLRYAHRMTQADGSVRIVLATDRRLGSFDGSWKPATGVANDYAFTVIELRLNPAMTGEGRTSLTGRVSIDGAANTIALEDYAVLPVTLKNLRPAHP